MNSTIRCIRILSIFGILVASTSVIRGQVDRPELRAPTEIDKTVLGSIRGRILMPGGNFVSTAVKVTLQSLRGTIAIIYTDNEGQFEFEGINPGNYQIEVDPTDRQQFQVSTEAVQVFKGMPSVVAHTLKTKERPKSPNHAKTISLAELDPKIPAGAKKEFAKASRASEKGMTEEAIAHLRKAIAIYPNFVMAHNDLGAQLLGQGKLEEAAQELRKAITLDGNSFNPALNLGIVLVQQQRFEEAANSLSKALSLQPDSPAARLYSGITLMALDNLDSAEKDFKTAYQIGGPRYALALFHLGQLYMNRGDRGSALKSFELYLNDVPNAANADQVRRLIAMLR